LLHRCPWPHTGTLLSTLSCLGICAIMRALIQPWTTTVSSSSLATSTRRTVIVASSSAIDPTIDEPPRTATLLCVVVGVPTTKVGFTAARNAGLATACFSTSSSPFQSFWVKSVTKKYPLEDVLILVLRQALVWPTFLSSWPQHQS